MKKRNYPHSGYYKVAGGAVEEPNATRQARQALAREKAGLKRRPVPKARHTEESAKQEAVQRSRRVVATVAPGRRTVEQPHPRAAPEREAPHPARAVVLAGRMLGLARRFYGLAERFVTLPHVIAEHFRHHDQQTA